ncbi:MULTISPECIES: FAD-binding oxidoreductase [Cyanophyceae]|uniref:FAD-binding oxidoreductase n=1 Tax=Cyanophyceae TaxID=3028117 RepID=UPI001684D6B0|nr:MULTISPECIES: FAD-binding oxidoreductase [Cyanophyceae]MBD1919119.1 FAD-binding oxidoreductase [Phormidium sp. FACHB-77]MBD2033120.1 FAD-binding oxidoreductase [Phormidium sp. FACHB-322]MBD2054048.1 FAD-binding oxidoreductase [Leptolyngbya sp. FACHB-60]
MANVAETLGEVVERDRILPPKSLNLPEYLTPEAVVYPTSEAELSAVMACAHEHRWRVIPCGSGSKLTWGGVGSGVDLVVSTARLDQVIDHAVGDMTLTTWSGAKLADFAPRLAQHNQFLAVDPAYPERATLGGIVATADTGSLRQRYGGLRDMLIGISFVRYDGAIAKAGGRVVKNVAGYDLMKLLTGSYGTLGIISQLTFRLYPGQDTSKTVVVTGVAGEIEALVNALRLSPLTPAALDILSPALANRLGYEGFALVARFQSIAPGVDEQVEALLAMVEPALSAQVLQGAEDEQVWAGVSAVLFPQSEEQKEAIVAKVGLPLAKAVAWLDQLPSGSLARIHGGSGIGTVRLAVATADMVNELHRGCTTNQGYFTLLEAPLSLKKSVDVWGYSGNALSVMQAIKAQFDPHHCLSPGRFVGGI